MDAMPVVLLTAIGAARDHGDRPSGLVLGVLLVPELVAGMDLRYLSKVVVRNRRRERPLQRPRIPRVIPGLLPTDQTHDQVDEEYGHGERYYERADSRHQGP